MDIVKKRGQLAASAASCHLFSVPVSLLSCEKDVSIDVEMLIRVTSLSQATFTMLMPGKQHSH